MKSVGPNKKLDWTHTNSFFREDSQRTIDLTFTYKEATISEMRFTHEFNAAAQSGKREHKS